MSTFVCAVPQCGRAFEALAAGARRRFCAECRVVQSRRRQAESRQRVGKRIVVPCWGCGGEARRRDSSEVGRGKHSFCSLSCVRISTCGCGEQFRTRGRLKCKKCTDANWRERNVERKRAADRAGYFANRERRRANGRAYYESHKAQAHAQSRAWSDANRERRREIERKSQSKRYEAHLVYGRRYARENREKCAERLRRWARANPEKAKATSERRRARVLGAAGEITALEWAAILKRQKSRCARCGARGKMTMDHIIPLSRGGSHFAFNIQALCKPCNSSKGAKLLAGAQHSLFDACNARAVKESHPSHRA